LQYVDLEVVRYAAGMLAAPEEAGHTLVCKSQPCERPIAYLIPDATRPGRDGQEVEQRPAIVCQEHLEEMLGHALEEQPICRRLEGPGQAPEA
jgi:hypothetical protein